MRDSIVPRRSILAAIIVVCLLSLILVVMGRLLVTRHRMAAVQAIHRAAQTGDIRSLRNLLQENPAFVNAPDEYGETALHKAANKEIAELLIASGADIGANDCTWMPIHSARNREVAEALLAAGADVNAKDGGGFTALHCANSKELAEFLIVKGADINAKASNGETPVRSAIRRGHRGLAEFLAASGAGVDIFMSAALGLTEKARVLLDSEPNLAHSTDYEVATPLHVAAEWGQVEVGKLLLSKGADVLAQDEHGRTPLHRATRTRHVSMVEMLLGSGADVNAKDKDGSTPLDVARGRNQEGYSQIVTLLRKHGAK